MSREGDLARRNLISLHARAETACAELLQVTLPVDGFPPGVDPDQVIQVHVARAQYQVAEALATGFSAVCEVVDDLVEAINNLEISR